MDYGGGGDDYGSGGGGGYLAPMGGGYPGSGSRFGGGGGGGAAGGAETSPGSKRQARESKTILPLTLHQLLTLPRSPAGDTYTFGPENLEVHLVRVIGAVVDMAESETMRCELIISDCTGMLQLVHYHDADDVLWHELSGRLRQKGVYIEVVGQVKVVSASPTPSLTPMDIRVVTDANTVTTHMLAAIQAYCVAARGPLVPTGPAAGASGGLAGASFGAASAFGGTSRALTYGGGDEQAGGPLGGKILHYLRADPRAASSSDGPGVHEDELKEFFGRQKPSYAPHEVSTALVALMNQGSVYTTVDEFHFHVTE